MHIPTFFGGLMKQCLRLLFLSLLSFGVLSPTGAAGAPLPDKILPGDVNLDGTVDVIDLQCSANVALWKLQSSVGPIPECAGDMPWTTDVNCDGQTDVVDFLLGVHIALALPMGPAMDNNADGIPDPCAPENVCADGACDGILAFDFNQDGVLSVQDWFETMGLLDLVDDNGDGALSAAEYLAHYPLTPNESPPALSEDPDTGSAPEKPPAPFQNAYDETGGEAGPGEEAGAAEESIGGSTADQTGTIGGGGSSGGLPIGPGVSQQDCNENYDKFDFLKVWYSHPSECVPKPDDPLTACMFSFANFCDGDGDGITDPDMLGVGVTLCGPGAKCTLYGSGGGTPAECPCSDDEITDPEPADCDPFLPTSPPPPDPGDPPHGDLPDACDFYGKILVQPGGCSAQDKILLGGYHETCRNATNSHYTAPGGADCKTHPAWRTYVDGLRYCLQETVSNQLTVDQCLMEGTSCAQAVNVIRWAHDTCNEENDFCQVMQDPSAGYCFGMALGDAWGAYLVGTTSGGPVAPLGLFQTVMSVLICGENWSAVMNNICEGYQDACMQHIGTGAVSAAACKLSCPTQFDLTFGPLLVPIGAVQYVEEAAAWWYDYLVWPWEWF
jgi:hypothetical protein